MKKRAIFTILSLCSALLSFAQGNGMAGISEATNMVTSYFDPLTKLIFAVAAILGLVLVATTLDKGNGLGYYTAVLFDPATHEIITQMDMVGKPGGFGLRNYWAGSVYNALKKQGKYLTK